MKNYLTYVLLLLAGMSSLTSCREDSKLPAPAIAGEVPLIIPVITSDPEKNHFDYTRAQLSDTRLANTPDLPNRTRPVFEFSFDLDNSRSKKVKAVEVYKSFLRGTTLGTRVLVGSYTSFPVTISLNSQDALTGLQRVIPQSPGLPYLLDVKSANSTTTNNPISRNDAIVFTFEYVLEDNSRVILTPVNTVTVGPGPGTATTPTTTVQVMATTTQTNAPYAAIAYFR